MTGWLDEARGWLLRHAGPLQAEAVPLAVCVRRSLAAPLPLPELPLQPVAAIDGHAVCAAETEGASDYAPLAVGGAPVRAGMALPAGTDAVLPPAAVGPGPVALVPVARGAFVLAPGHDVAAGACLPAGTVLRPLHLVVLADAGCSTVLVHRRAGIELRAAGVGHMLGAALISAAGGAVAVGAPDLVLTLVPMDPDAPALVGLVSTAYGERPGLTLPADPVRCADLFAVLAGPVISRMSGGTEPRLEQAVLSRKIISGLGQADIVRVRLLEGRAIPLGPAGGTGLLAAADADGLVVVPENSEGYPARALVTIHPVL